MPQLACLLRMAFVQVGPENIRQLTREASSIVLLQHGIFRVRLPLMSVCTRLMLVERSR